MKEIPLPLVSEVNEFSAQRLAEAIGASTTTLTIFEIGNQIVSQYDKKWSGLTKKTYAKKFLNWLRFCGLVERVKGEKGYKLTQNSTEF